MPVTVSPLPGTTFGAVVTDVDLANIDDDAWAAVEAAYYQYGLLIFPGQHLSQDRQTRFAARFGKVIPDMIRPGGDDHYTVSNRRPDGTLLSADSSARVAASGNESWHFDRTFLPVENKCSLLAAVEVPSSDGGTGFADMRAAYDAFDQATKDRIAGVHAYHSLFYSMAAIGMFPKTMYHSGTVLRGTEVELRPLVKTHPVTGRPFFHAGRHAFGIPGMSPEGSEKMLEELTELACQPPRTYEHLWTAGDVVLWDQQRCAHRARPYDPRQVRILRGTGVLGDPATESSVTGTPDAGRGSEALAAELRRLRAKGIVRGTLPRAAL